MSESSKELKEGLRRYFAAFGDDVAEVIYHSMTRYGGLDSVLAKLGLQNPGNSDDQYTAIYNFLRHSGKKEFMEKMGGLSKNYQIVPEAVPVEVLRNRERGNEILLKHEKEIRTRRESVEKSPPKPQKVETPVQPLRMVLPAREDETQRLVRDDDRIPSTAPAKAEPVPTKPATVPEPVKPAAMAASAPMPVTVPGTRIAMPLKPGKAPAPGTFDKNTPGWDPSKPQDPTGEWPAVERRNGIERRQRPDPRREVELIFKNRRFGRDRRQNEERRQNWPQTGFVRAEDQSKS